jgi:hypothetical protein
MHAAHFAFLALIKARLPIFPQSCGRQDWNQHPAYRLAEDDDGHDIPA